MSLFKRKPKSDLLKTATEQTVQMLERCREMFHTVTSALAEDAPPEDIRKIKKMDKEINRLHRDVRRKVFEHLAIVGNRDLYHALILLSVVDDSERVGDYNKNIAEIIGLMPDRLDFGRYAERFRAVWEQTNEFFESTLRAFIDDDEETAYKVLEQYGALSDICDDVIDEILAGKEGESIRRDLLALVLLMRFFKRVNAHLKNIASTIVNPFDRIGYRPKKSR